MSNYSVVQAAIDIAKQNLASDPDGNLDVHWRIAIWEALGPVEMDGKVSKLGIGARRRTHLAAQCVCRGLPLWEKAMRDNRKPHEVLELAERYFAGTANKEQLNSAGTELWDLVEELGADSLDIGLYIGAGASKFALVALYDAPFDDPEYKDRDCDDKRDAWDWDPALHIALAVAGGFPRRKTSSPEERRQFWEWYLREAVSTAWNSVPE